MKAIRNEEEAVSPVIGVILMVAIVVILAAVIAAFVFGMAGSTQTTKNVATTVTMLDNGTGAITIQGGADLGQVKWIMYSVAGSDFRNVTDTPAVNANATAPFEVGETVYTETTSVDGLRLVLRASFDDGSDQVIFDRQF
ncbi:MAG TPA: type IV pilin N-terminal domain-containing protein [Methanoregulaceae archaeon]|jgi:flagellin-like protein|nr:type IV pilin N-terminal domain-containing protein [Methanoregulaceae archaeon]